MQNSKSMDAIVTSILTISCMQIKCTTANYFNFDQDLMNCS
ncbi:hypothetical protein GXM_06429 [Nostoc sphaeroides CCNUC1]|uniref:Uncharacterized protein n=1 Tax=Nostoc sphaeroides CCNUC1 TaxID=2653204 RepID=A0A5P8W852_9NOSO|nr:hypothetical protein GXM_06429 [Nostoc sphaeroides CCNUC1]